MYKKYNKSSDHANERRGVGYLADNRNGSTVNERVRGVGDGEEVGRDFNDWGGRQLCGGKAMGVMYGVMTADLKARRA